MRYVSGTRTDDGWGATFGPGSQGRRFRSAPSRRTWLSFEDRTIDRLATASPAMAAINPATDDTRPAIAVMTSETPELVEGSTPGGGTADAWVGGPTGEPDCVDDGAGDPELVDDGDGDPEYVDDGGGTGERSPLRKPGHSVTIPTASSTKPTASRVNPRSVPLTHSA